ncbi:PH domain-containing protein [Sporolactobacillus kofuensis]|uniref:PH domain-containing protein n=1 Tax=Sporolactobacillus kofuensis TaxID=269672 RepID=A0ABW1WG48_9BACL|nr:PH domain-containing protein [Sporolactobacillus kofuensis]MCO7175095.1 PH domain-containing protein [Sporolactobacillus kofuensis]
MNSKGKHLHFFAIFNEALSTLWSILVPLMFGFIWGVRHLDTIFGYIIIIPLIILIFNFFKWLRFTYEFVDDQFHIRSGVLVRNDRYIRIQRIQSVQIKTNLLMRPLGIVQLKFDTADPAVKGDMILSALKRTEAEKIKAQISRGKTEQAEQVHSEEIVSVSPNIDESPLHVYTLSGKRLVAASLLYSKIGVMLAAVFGLWSQADDLIPDRIRGRSLSYIEHVSLVGIIIIIGFAILLLWLFSLITTLFKWGGFKLSIYHDEWRIHRGILETRDETYKIDRVQAIRIKEQWLQQLFGWCTLYAECSGSIDSEKGDGGSVLIFPLIRKTDLPIFLENVMPKFSGPITINQLPIRGALYRMIIPIAFWFSLSSILAWWLPWGKYTFLALPLILVYCWIRLRSEGYALNEDRLIFVNRLFAKTTTITRKNNIQSFAKKNSRTQRRLNLASCSATVRASSAETYTMRQLDERDAHKLFHWFRN